MMIASLARAAGVEHASMFSRLPARKDAHRSYFTTRCLCKREDEDINATPVDHHRMQADRDAKEPKSLIRDLSKSVMPEEAGDWKDYFWMTLSTAVLVYFSACLFMVYDYLYRAAGFVTFAEFMSQ